MGGKKNKALYFVGYQEDSLLFLDPHYEQESIEKTSWEDPDVESYSCKMPKTLDMRHLDTCLGVGFYVKNSEDFDMLKRQLKSLKKKHKEYNLIPVR